MSACVSPSLALGRQHSPLTHPTHPPPEPGKTMVTELWLAEDEFQTAAVAPGSRITFCLKEFRVSSCPALPSPMSPLSPPLNLLFVPRGC